MMVSFLAGRVSFHAFQDVVARQLRENFHHLLTSPGGGEEPDLRVELSTTPLRPSPGRAQVALAGFEGWTREKACKCVHGPLLQWHARRGAPVWHAAAVGWNGLGVLLLGPQDCGKTTLALECARAGADFLGDDYVAVRSTESGVEAGSLYAWAWVADGAERRRQFLPLPDTEIRLAARLTLAAVVGVAPGEVFEARSPLLGEIALGVGT